MNTIYCVTGATSYPGNNLVKILAARGENVRALLLPGDKLESALPSSTKILYGDVTGPDSMEDFFRHEDGDDVYVVHCAGIVTLNEAFNQKVYDVNVGGTKNVIAMCLKYRVKKLVHISSSSAIPLLPKGRTMSEVDYFDPALVCGVYAKTKAEATQLVLDAARDGLDASVIHPTAIFGPGAYGASDLINTVIGIYTGKMKFTVNGGVDFIDARDLAGCIISCCHNGRKGECYIAGGQYHSFRELFACVKKVSGHGKLIMTSPAWLVKAIAPISEWFGKIRKTSPALTRFSIAQLVCNTDYSKQKAIDELDLQCRPFEESVRDTLAFLKAEGRI